MKNYMPWIVRILISGLFLLSAVAKMFPHLWMFEKQMVDLGLVTWCQTPYLSRAIIGLELAIAFAILQPHFLKRIIIPCTILLLLAFCAHLGYQIALHGNDGNCGCFGQLIKMTPLEAIIKNVITILMLVYLFSNVQEKEKGKNNFIYPFAIFLACELFMFVWFPFCPCDKKAEKPVTFDSTSNDTINNVATNPFDTGVAKPIITIGLSQFQKDSILKIEKAKKDSIKKAGVVPVVAEVGPAKVASKFAAYTMFDGKNMHIDEGKKIVCMFAPGCEHCQAKAKSLCALKSNNPAEVLILFMDEETEKIPDFFKFAGCKFPYQVLKIGDFWTTLGSGNTPSVTCLWNGNIIKEWEGIKENEFKPEYLNGVWKK
jgi:thiol-disulfide isomerase/thioredoxin